MKFTTIAIAAQLLVVSWAYTIGEGYIKINDNSIHFGEINTQEIKQLLIESPKDKIEINLKLKEDLDTRPHQVVVAVSSAENSQLVTHFVPTFTASNQIKLTIASSKLPEVLKVQKKLVLNLIVADPGNSDNLFKQLVELIPSEEFQATAKYQPKARVGHKPEIHHIFREEPKTINATIPIIFIGGGLVLFVVLLGAWASFIGADLFGTLKTVSKLQLTYNIAFLTTLIGFEANFVKYYLGQSIFATLFNSFFLGLAGIYFGSKVLRSLGENRKVGKF